MDLKILTISFEKLGVNIQLATEGNESLPFVPFSNFNGAKYSEMLFLYGHGDCGKSRAIVELVKENLGDFKKIYFIIHAKCASLNRSLI
jgi:hypothetical protein